MKKILLSICLLLFFYALSAPELSIPLQIDKAKEIFHDYNNLVYEKELNDFINHLGYIESNNNWKAINDIDCFGEWQFSHNTLKHIGYGHITPEKFKNNYSIFPRKLQIKALKTLIKINEIRIKEYENDYIGTTIDGIPITRGGLIAGSHLGGTRGVEMFLSSYGKIDNKDMNGAKISDYIKEFSIYDLVNKNENEIIDVIIYKKKIIFVY